MDLIFLDEVFWRTIDRENVLVGLRFTKYPDFRGYSIAEVYLSYACISSFLDDVICLGKGLVSLVEEQLTTGGKYCINYRMGIGQTLHLVRYQFVYKRRDMNAMYKDKLATNTQLMEATANLNMKKNVA